MPIASTRQRRLDVEPLAADNVTPPTRTPWGGLRIAARYKPGIGLPLDLPLGECWELSVEPSFPSRLARSGERLDQVIARDPVAWLGQAVSERYGGQLPLLVKLLDSGTNLSVQVHPADDDPGLAPDESGKPEAWIVLEAAPGAGIYLGLREGVGRAEVEAALDANAALDALLNFVPVAPGDVYEVGAGTVHAIGAGITLVEPQHVLPGRRGLTYRLWDWGRRYDLAGRPDPRGRPRELHLARALAVTDWQALRGPAFVDGCRRQPRRIANPGGLERWHLLSNPFFAAERWSGSGELEIDVEGLIGLVCVGGSAWLGSGANRLQLGSGESAVVPAALARLAIEGHDLQLYACRPLAPSRPHDAGSA
ncbi:MAG: class I mannose-6-phosphate isomerase [Chloroflexi bacterium]|nr:class I mannose-6-phosphate isomerase [Chloroflexota bacterium]